MYVCVFALVLTCAGSCTGPTQKSNHPGFCRGYVPAEEAPPSTTRLYLETKDRRYIINNHPKLVIGVQM